MGTAQPGRRYNGMGMTSSERQKRYLDRIRRQAQAAGQAAAPSEQHLLVSHVRRWPGPTLDWLAGELGEAGTLDALNALARAYRRRFGA